MRWGQGQTNSFAAARSDKMSMRSIVKTLTTCSLCDNNRPTHRLAGLQTATAPYLSALMHHVAH